VRPEKRELTKLIVLDFMLVHANDWYVISFDQPLGSLCRVEALLVRDVFGGTTLVSGPTACLRGGPAVDNVLDVARGRRRDRRVLPDGRRSSGRRSSRVPR
jgi:hypothetical protein